MTKGPNDELIPRKSAALYFATGIAAVLMGYSIYSHLKQVQVENSSSKKKLNRTGLRLEDSVHLKSLAYLTQSNNVVIQSSAVKIILERAMSGKNIILKRIYKKKCLYISYIKMHIYQR
ncbi:hypothetical protein K501DRAFT_189742 [Backusella circina FSU 941]|nr:hypothetical protein K501DRAFT_189742 [Backusella circina FSU 941]